jgi:hypothetical protein
MFLCGLGLEETQENLAAGNRQPEMLLAPELLALSCGEC